MRTKFIFLLVILIFSTTVCSCGSTDYLAYREKPFSAGIVCRTDNKTYIYSVNIGENKEIKFTSPKGLNGIEVKDENGEIKINLNDSEVCGRQYGVLLKFADFLINEEISEKDLKSAEKNGEFICAVYETDKTATEIRFKSSQNGYIPTEIKTNEAEIDIEWFEWK